MSSAFGKENVDVCIEHEPTGFVRQFLFDDFGPYETTDGQKFETKDEAREQQNYLNRTRGI